MKKLFALLLALSLIVGVALTASATAATPVETIGTVPNGDREVPYTALVPAGDGPFPLVVICHGHGGSRQENGGFGRIAAALAEKGIASIRMDFPGCGDSKASFAENYLSNMISDVDACLAYALSALPVDPTHVGILGYSMGGRIAMLMANREANPFSAIGMLAPAADNGNGLIMALMGGEEAYLALEAEANKELGYVDFTTIYGQQLKLSREWFNELHDTNPLDGVTYAGPALIVYGDKDVVVPEAVSLATKAALEAACASVQVVVVPEADHGYGFYSDQPDVTALVNSSFADFFAGALK